jgi:hypothetical protein
VVHLLLVAGVVRIALAGMHLAHIHGDEFHRIFPLKRRTSPGLAPDVIGQLIDPNTSRAGRRSRNAPSLNVPPTVVESSKSVACSPGAGPPEKCMSSLIKSRRKDS